jgi:phospholipid-translocating ATPase
MYQEITGNKLFGWKKFLVWIMLAIYHSVVIYWFTYFIWSNTPALFISGQTLSLYCFGTFLIHCVVFVVSLKLFIEVVYSSCAFIVITILSILSLPASIFVYSLLPL